VLWSNGVNCGNGLSSITKGDRDVVKTKIPNGWKRFIGGLGGCGQQKANYFRAMYKERNRVDERGWETGRSFGVSARAHPRLYKVRPEQPGISTINASSPQPADDVEDSSKE
jgi:hypothetical protein